MYKVGRRYRVKVTDFDCSETITLGTYRGNYDLLLRGKYIDIWYIPEFEEGMILKVERVNRNDSPYEGRGNGKIF